MGILTERVSGEERDNKVEERRKQILDAAEALIAQKGYQGMTMDDIVRESRLSKGTLYWYFKSKKEIILSLMDRALQVSQTQMKAVLEDKATFVERMQTLFDYFTGTEGCSYPDDDRIRELLVNTEFWRQAIIDPEINAKLNEIYQWQTEFGQTLVREALEKGEIGEIDPVTVTDLVIAVLDGTSLRWLVNPKGVSLQGVTNTFLQILFKGLGIKDKA